MTEARPAGALGSRGATSRRQVVAWALWDWATQPFQTVITTFVFAVYITSSAFGDTNSTSQSLSLSTTIAGVIVALIAPVLGQNSDRTGRTVRNLSILTWVLAALSASLFFVRPDPGYLWLGLGILGVYLYVSIAGRDREATRHGRHLLGQGVAQKVLFCTHGHTS